VWVVTAGVAEVIGVGEDVAADFVEAAGDGEVIADCPDAQEVNNSAIGNIVAATKISTLRIVIMYMLLL
jgi:hypothetical protein